MNKPEQEFLDHLLKVRNYSEKTVHSYQEDIDLFCEYIFKEKELEQLFDQLNAYIDGGWVDNTNPLPFRLEFKKAYWDSLTDIKPAEVAKGLDMPMLFLQGDSDVRVFADKDYAIWQQELGDKAGCYFKLYEGLGHFFNEKTGSFDTEVMDDIAGFAKEIC